MKHLNQNSSRTHLFMNEINVSILVIATTTTTPWGC